MLRTHKEGKVPGGCGGWGLGSRNRRGPGVPPPLVSEGREPHLGAQPASWAQVGGANTLYSSHAPPGWPLLPVYPDLPGLPPMPPGPTWPEWGFGGGYLLGSSAGSPAQVGETITLCSSPTLLRESLTPASPELPCLTGADPVWPPLSSPPVPLRLTSSLWGSSHLLGHQSPPAAAGRCPSCGETLTSCFPTLPS